MKIRRFSWLASYPKSGNTWVRMLLSAYHMRGNLRINELVGSVSDTRLSFYQAVSPVPVEALSLDQRILLRPSALLYLSEAWRQYRPLVTKTHMARVELNGIELFPPCLTERALYLIRDPRDVAVSYARHFGLTPERAVESMLMDTNVIAPVKNGRQITQYIGSWGLHVRSWARCEKFSVTVVRYEDLLNDPEGTFTKILRWYGIDIDPFRVSCAVEACRFDRVKAAEDLEGFEEVGENQERFFNTGCSGGWREALSPELARQLEDAFRDLLLDFGYMTEEEDYGRIHGERALLSGA